MTDDFDIEPAIKMEPLDGHVIQIDEFRIARGRMVSPKCMHQRFVFCREERVVICQDCHMRVDPIDALWVLYLMLQRYQRQHDRAWEAIRKAREETIHRIAARNLAKEWSSKRMVPACPHCSRGLLPSDFEHGFTSVNKEIELERRKFTGGKP